MEVEAPPSVVLNRLLRERHLWDEDFAQAKVIETIDNQTEVYQYVVDSMAPHPSKDSVVMRYVRLYDILYITMCHSGRLRYIGPHMMYNNYIYQFLVCHIPISFLSLYTLSVANYPPLV